MKKPQQPKVSIISVNFNQCQVTCDMLDSLRHISYQNVEIIVVDNGSKEDCSVIKQAYPEVIFIRSEENLGFAGGNNLGFEVASGDYILLLNNDTEVASGFLEPLLDTFAKHPKAGIVSPKLIFFYSDRLIQYAGTGNINALTCRGETHGFMQPDGPAFSFEAKTSLAHGACMMISRAAVEAAGTLDASYFLCYEEYDYCERVKQLGFEIYYNGHSEVLHKQSISMGKTSPLKSYYMTRNRIYFARKNFRGWSRSSALLFTYLVAVPKNMLAEWLKGRAENSLAIWKGATWNLKNPISTP
ncbi:MAG: glycosyltransferase family 2 protein [Chitinophagales bacterium]|nr:glycosyltransferase family 2 protein [Chitinophagales bacterium]